MADKKRILIAEDEQPLSHAMELKLTSAGFEVKVVADGQLAKDALTTESFDLVLLDIMMPLADGFNVLAEMKQKGITTPVVIMSNLSQPEDKEKAKALGAVSFFVKSDISLEELVAQVKAVIGQ